MTIYCKTEVKKKKKKDAVTPFLEIENEWR